MVFAACRRCGVDTKHRLVRDKGGHYLACAVCLESNCKKHRKNHWYKYLAQKANARKRPNSDKLTGEDITRVAENQGHKCALTGVPFDVESKHNKASLDRIDSSKGYSIDNIHLVLWIVNRCKSDLCLSDFVKMCKRVAGGGIIGKPNHHTDS